MDVFLKYVFAQDKGRARKARETDSFACRVLWYTMYNCTYLRPGPAKALPERFIGCAPSPMIRILTCCFYTVLFVYQPFNAIAPPSAPTLVVVPRQDI